MDYILSGSDFFYFNVKAVLTQESAAILNQIQLKLPNSSNTNFCQLHLCSALWRLHTHKIPLQFYLILSVLRI